MNALPAEALRRCAELNVTPTRYFLAVSLAEQTLSLFENFAFVKMYRCSTSRFGIGETAGSKMTPRGLHRIAEKIGAGCPAGTAFEARQALGIPAPGSPPAAITTRILWLDGLEPGRNQGGDVDSHARYIYIHGTGSPHTIGQPATQGCIHLADDDLIYLFDLVPEGTLVWNG
ncbi:MAG TPA: L,D-transpeptidase [Verrucomicrobiae bacterium]|jgi:hypothetical protein|nr:L,D-transpeptidase [Verrucomicrobiae bacterium]